jgi:hypothetical protein
VKTASTPEPYVGTRPFGREDSENFFGRDGEADDLLSLVLAVPVVLVYAASGAGKSSLLNAGLIPRLEKEGFQVLGPAQVTGPAPPETLQITNIYRFHTLSKLNCDLSSIATASELALLTLADFLQRLDKREPGRPRALLFDQFEKFFAVNVAQSEQRRAFIDELAQASRAASRLKVVFAMREEYIAQFEVFEYSLPDKLRTRMRLEPLRERAALEAIERPLEKVDLVFDKASGDPAKALVHELLKIRVDAGGPNEGGEIIGEFVEPIQLQVVCQNMWRNFPDELKTYAAERQGLPLEVKREKKIITRDQVRIGDVDQALAQHYDRAIENAIRASGASEGQLRRWFDSSLITGVGERGIALDSSDETRQLPETALELFLDQRLVRKESRGGSVWYELTHDRFIEPIQRSNRAWFEQRAVSEALRSKLEAKAQIPGAFLDESETRDAEAFLASTDAGVLGTSPEVASLVRASRLHVEEEKARKARELEDARKQAELEHARAEAITRARKRERIFGVTIFLLGIIILIAVGTFAWFANAQAQEHKKKAQRLREKAKDELDAADGTNPIKDVSALRNLSAALNLNPRDTEAVKMTRDLLLQGVWCPPAEADVRYEKDALLAATFVRGESNNEIFAVSGDGQLLRVNWKARALRPVKTYGKQGHDDGSLFKKPELDDQHVVQPSYASFSPDGQWLLIIPPTLASAAIAEAAAQGAAQHGGPPSDVSSGQESCNLGTWQWTPQNHTYEPAGVDLKIQPFPRSLITNFTWSGDSHQVVLIGRQSGGANPECKFFQVDENSVKEIPDRSAQLTRMKIVAVAFSADLARIAAVSSECKITLIRRDDFQVISNVPNPLPEGIQPNAIVFGPGDEELTLIGWGGIGIVNIRNGDTREPIRSQRTFRDQFMRMVVRPGDSATRLAATSLYARVHVAQSAHMEEPAEPVVFRGTMGIPQFSPDGQRLLILSGGIWNVFDTIRLIDVSPLYRPQEAPPEKFKEQTAPPWLADIASAVSALDVGGDGSLLTLKAVRKRHPESKAGDPYEWVWNRFFPEEKSDGHLGTAR